MRKDVQGQPIEPAEYRDFTAWLDQESWRECVRCNLCTERNVPPIFGRGNPESRLMIVGEAPGATEEEMGKVFVGRSGCYLQDCLFYLGLSEKDVYLTNAVACRPLDNRTPLVSEVSSCNVRLQEEIYAIDPLIIVALGTTAAKALLGSGASLTKHQGKLSWANVRSRVLDKTPLYYPVMVTWHPSFLLRTYGQDAPESAIKFIRQYSARWAENEDPPIRFMWNLYKAHIFRVDAMSREMRETEPPQAVRNFYKVLPDLFST